MIENKIKDSKLAIIGAGAVGSSMAFAAAIRGVAREIVLYDVNLKKVQAEALDIAQGSQFYPATTVTGSDDMEALRGSDVVVITAGARQAPGETRIDLAGKTIEIMKSIIPAALAVAPDAIYILVTNPVDVVTYASLKISGLPCNQMFGSGTVLDTSRLRSVLADYLGVSVQNIHAYIAGEHGDSEVPLWSSAGVAGVPLLDWRELAGHQPLTQDIREQMHKDVVNSAYTIIDGKGATNYAIAISGVDIISSVTANEHRIMPVSSLIHDFHGIDDVCMSLPALVDSSGVRVRLDTPLSADEKVGLLASAQTLKETAKKFGF
jgi:L-lactate dehydrogenase